MCQESFKGFSPMFQWCSKEISRVFKKVLMMFLGRFKGVSRKFQWCFRKVAWMLHESFKVFQ